MKRKKVCQMTENQNKNNETARDLAKFNMGKVEEHLKVAKMYLKGLEYHYHEEEVQDAIADIIKQVSEVERSMLVLDTLSTEVFDERKARLEL